ncbi:hypothetical protein HGM15179_021845, partial [Zosterops borbonicus]
VPFLIDTRADVTVIPETNWPRLWTLEEAPRVGGVRGFQSDKFIPRATAVHSSPPIKLRWKSSNPIWVEQWPLSEPRMTVLLELLDHELQQGHIEPSTSPWNTPVFVTPKRSGEGFRLLHDLREVNKKIQPIGPVQTLLPANSMIPEGQPCAVLEIEDCFFSIPLCEEDKEQFAFSVMFLNGQRPNLRFQWKVLLQSMVNSPTICQVTVDRALVPIWHTDPTATIVQYMDDILIATPSAGQIDRLVTTLSQTLKASEKRGPCVTFLGVQITNSYVTPQQIKIPWSIKTLHDMQQLVGSLQWIQNIVLIPPEVMSLLYDLLKGKHPWEQKALTPEASNSLDFFEQQISSSTLARWNPGIPLDLYVHFTEGGGVEALSWGKPSHVFSPGVECLGNLIMKGRKLALNHLGIEPAKIYLPFRKQFPILSVAMSEHLALALVGFAGEIQYATKPPWTELLAIVDIDLPPKVMDRPLPGPTSEEQWRCVKMTDHTLSVQQLEASALVLACGLFTKEHLNIVTDSMFVAKLCLAMARPGVAASTTAVMIEEALLSREGTVSVIHVNSHNPIKGFFQTGNDKADATAKGLWTLRDAHQLHETLHIGAKALARKCGIITDNGPNFVSKSIQTFASKWNITLVHGIPHNSTGQAIVERANQTLKAKLEVLAKAEGFANVVPPGDQACLLATAMLALNQFPRGDETKSPAQKHWAVQSLEEGPPVTIRNELGEWEQGWQLVLTGRGYA